MELVLNEMPTLCLNMIVKNESKIITRLFDSVLPIIDCYCICDTGSTDNTIEIIQNYFNSKGIKGVVVTEPFKNFCHNRNFALKSCIGMSDYVLLMDADMVLEIKEFNKLMLNAFDSLYILQGNNDFYYKNMRIVKNNGLYKYVGVTHEYIDVPPNNKVSCIEKSQLFITDLGDGGSKHDKFERDITLLLDGIKDEPQNSERYYFYLANSYHDSGQFEKAISAYKKRIEYGGWREEVWYSYYRIGLCYKNTGKMSDAINIWLEGYDFYPDRLEGLYEIMNYYRLNSKHKLGNMIYQLAKMHLDKNSNRDNYLFLHNDVYTYKLYYEYTIIAAYVGVTNINNEIMQILNNSKNSPLTNNLLNNMKFYKDILKQKTKLVFDDNKTFNVNGNNVSFYSSSSCLIPYSNETISNEKRYIMNIRYVNYFIDNNGGYLNCDDHIITLNKYMEFNEELQPINEQFMEWSFDNRRYIGTEDVRIFNDVETNALTFIGTGYHSNNKIGIVTGFYNTDALTLNAREVNQNFRLTNCEKNWVFVDFNHSTHIIYDWYPLTICKLNNDDKNELEMVETREMPLFFSNVRGSSCGFNYIKNDITEIWFVNHIVSYESPRHYYHIISVFDTNMKLLRYSAPFKFEGECIEYCLSIVVEDEQVLINYSTWDRTTRIGVYDKKYIDSIVKYNPLL
jgi:tetratricopeptide (TPR) repeat protein